MARKTFHYWKLPVCDSGTSIFPTSHMFRLRLSHVCWEFSVNIFIFGWFRSLSLLPSSIPIELNSTSKMIRNRNDIYKISQTNRIGINTRCYSSIGNKAERQNSNKKWAFERPTKAEERNGREQELDQSS